MILFKPAWHLLVRVGIAALAIGSAVSAASQSKTVVYACGSDKITVRYQGIDSPAGAASAVLRLPNGRSVTLPQAMSGSGARYANGSVTLWEHQGTALIETPGRTWTDCRPHSN